MTTPTASSVAELAAECKRLADDYASKNRTSGLCSGSGDMGGSRDFKVQAGIAKRELHAAIARLEAAAQQREPVGDPVRPEEWVRWGEMPWRPTAVGFASAVDIESYAPQVQLGQHLPGVRDVPMYTRDQVMCAVSHALSASCCPKAAPGTICTDCASASAGYSAAMGDPDAAPAQKPAEHSSGSNGSSSGSSSSGSSAAPSEALGRAMELADSMAAAATDYCDPPSEEHDRFYERREALRAHLSQCIRAEDTERLNWLEKKAPGQIHFDHTPKQRAGGHYIEIRVPFPTRYRSNAPDLRTAIDAARTTKPEV